MSRNSITIIIPTYNRAEYLAQALNSALLQDYDDKHILVIDNASTDNTQAVVSQFLNHKGVSYIRNSENLGMVGNWRKALEKIESDWFVMLSDDDYFIDSGYLSRAACLLEKEPSLKLVFSNSGILNTEIDQLSSTNIDFPEIVSGFDVAIMRRKIKPYPFILCNVVFNTQLAKNYGAFSNASNLSCDSELFLYSCFNGKVGFIKDVTTIYRVHSSNLSLKINVNFDCFVNNWDYFLASFSRAWEQGLLSQYEFKRFQWSVVFPSVLSILLRTLMYRSFSEYSPLASKLSKDASIVIRNSLLMKIALELGFWFLKPTLYIKKIINTIIPKNRSYP